MCGILGGNFPAWDYEKGLKSMYHRGPDGQRVMCFDGFTMAFTRLSIMDLSENGMQPMASPDGNVVITYNGEIYGYGALRRKLAKKYPFRSTSDTEVILYAYLEYGDGFVDQIDGMFAIAILDRRTRQLKLYRDRAGIKPLYYCTAQGHLAFASELKALRAAAGERRWPLDETALYDYLFYQYIPAPKTMYRTCKKLLPAHRLVYDLAAGKALPQEPYWKLKVNPEKAAKRNPLDVQEELRSLIHASVAEQLVADVPVGTFLSGGIDSSIVTYEANQHSPQIKSFTIGFPDVQYDESFAARELVEAYHWNGKIDIVEPKAVEHLKKRLSAWYDEPFADTSAFPTYVVSQVARRDVTVALTGDGGDELFGGYLRYRVYDTLCRRKKWDSAIVSKMARELAFPLLLVTPQQRQAYLQTSLECYLPVIFLADRQEVQSFQRKWLIDEGYDPTWYLKQYDCEDLPPITRARYLDFHTYLPEDCLTKVDRASMATSLECRVPLLSRRIIEFAFSLSQEECCTAQDLKKVLKDAYRGRLPDALFDRKKRGFSLPPTYRKARYANVPRSVSVLAEGWPELYHYEKEAWKDVKRLCC